MIQRPPPLPASWKTGPVSGLRPHGGCTVSQRWEDGKLVDVTVRADRDASVRVHHGQSTRDLALKAGRPVRIAY
jgi:hypothetical protein